MAIQQINNKVYTYYDYLNFPNDEFVEIIDGKIFAMSPAPSRITSRINNGNFSRIKKLY